VIKWSWADKACNIQYPGVFITKRGVSCDPARFGDDETVIYGWAGSQQIKRDVFGHKDEDFVAARCLAALKDIDGNWIAVGGGAIGQSVITRLNKIVDDDITVIEVNEASKADDPGKFYNKRAEMYWEAGELMSNGLVSLIHDKVNVGQLSAHTYGYASGRILIDEKDEIKKRIGRSPDYADATVIGLWALKRAPEHLKRRGEPTSTEKWIEIRQREAQGVGINYYDLQDEEADKVDAFGNRIE
jgi:hypothetical protein